LIIVNRVTAVADVLRGRRFVSTELPNGGFDPNKEFK
jgi:hypothetical protein